MAENTKPTVGRIIERELEARGWTRGDLARAMGCSERDAGRIINGRKRVTPEVAARLATAFGTSAEFWVNLGKMER